MDFCAAARSGGAERKKVCIGDGFEVGVDARDVLVATGGDLMDNPAGSSDGAVDATVDERVDERVDELAGGSDGAVDATVDERVDERVGEPTGGSDAAVVDAEVDKRVDERMDELGAERPLRRERFVLRLFSSL